AVEENLPSDAETSEWNWQALATWANTRYGLNLKDRDLRRFYKRDRDPEFDRDETSLDRDGLEEFLIEKASETIKTVDLTPSREFLDPDWGRRSLAGWAHHKFGLALDPAAWAGMPRADVTADLKAKARELYARKEAEFPVQVGLTRFLAERS